MTDVAEKKIVFRSPSARTSDGSSRPPGCASMKASNTVGSAAIAVVMATPMPAPNTIGDSDSTSPSERRTTRWR